MLLMFLTSNHPPWLRMSTDRSAHRPCQQLVLPVCSHVIFPFLTVRWLLGFVLFREVAWMWRTQVDLPRGICQQDCVIMTCFIWEIGALYLFILIRHNWIMNRQHSLGAKHLLNSKGEDNFHATPFSYWPKATTWTCQWCSPWSVWAETVFSFQSSITI